MDTATGLKKITFEVPEALHARLKAAVARDRTTVREIMNALAEAYVTKVENRDE